MSTVFQQHKTKEMSASNSPPVHTYVPPDASVSRSPCPALNALANHGYIPRTGTNIPFWDLLYAIKHVYNLSFPLAFLLTIFGFLTCGSISLNYSHPSKKQPTPPHTINISTLNYFPLPTWFINLSSLSTRGPTKITHNASLVHPDDISSSSPDPTLLANLLRSATQTQTAHTRSPPPPPNGLTLADLGRLHAAREASLRHPLNWLHEQVALGECGLAWCVMRKRSPPPPTYPSGPSPAETHAEQERAGVIPPLTLKQWFGEERLPDGWWGLGGARPAEEVGLLEARRMAQAVGEWGSA